MPLAKGVQAGGSQRLQTIVHIPENMIDHCKYSMLILSSIWIYVCGLGREKIKNTRVPDEQHCQHLHTLQ